MPKVNGLLIGLLLSASVEASAAQVYRQKVPLTPERDALSFQLRKVGLKVWQQLKLTKTAQYAYMRDAAELWSHIFTCPEIDQDVARDLTPIDRHAQRLIAEVVGTYFEDEWDVIEQLSDEDQLQLFDNLAQTVYAFELGVRTTESPTKLAVIDSKQRQICKDDQRKYRNMFIALKRKAVLAEQALLQEKAGPE